MPSSTEFDGVWTALITPFLESDEIDWSAFEGLLQLQKDAGVTGVVIAGSTGEGSTLTAQEKLALIRKAKAFLGDNVRVMANVGGSSTRQSVELAKLAADAGADSLLVVTPPYNKPTLNGLMLHYETIGNATSLPICLYHVPSRTGQRLTIPQIQQVTSIKNVAAVKEATGDIVFFGAAKRACSAVLLSGDDPTYLPSLAVGARGVISVITNILPKPFVEMTKSFWQGKYDDAQVMHDKLAPMFEALACESNPGPLKSALALKGLCKNVLRAPLVPVTRENDALIAKVFSLS